MSTRSDTLLSVKMLSGDVFSATFFVAAAAAAVLTLFSVAGMLSLKK